jgi:hypothetical protein
MLVLLQLIEEQKKMKLQLNNANLHIIAKFLMVHNPSVWCKGEPNLRTIKAKLKKDAIEGAKEFLKRKNKSQSHYHVEHSGVAFIIYRRSKNILEGTYYISSVIKAIETPVALYNDLYFDL